MPFLIIIAWAIFAFFSFGITGLNYVWARRAAKRPWKIKKDGTYLPKISVIVPTYNEREVIDYKLRNLARLEYPEDSLQLVFVDSNSKDSTADAIRDFAEKNPRLNTKLLVEKERNGKSAALNNALQLCTGDVIVISDADCFWPSNILYESLPYLADPNVGAISGPKKLLNPLDSWVTKSEDKYLTSANLMKLGESKASSTILFEGGFSAYKRDLLKSIDPYNTGSDDCGSVISCLEKNLRAIMITEGEFFTTFARSLKARMEMKIRRGGQMVQVLNNYSRLLLKGNFKKDRAVVIRYMLMYGLAPVMFLFLVATTIYLTVIFPPTVVILALFLIPQINVYLIEVLLGYAVMLYSFVSAVSKRRFLIWKKPEDRISLTEDILVQRNLI